VQNESHDVHRYGVDFRRLKKPFPARQTRLHHKLNLIGWDGKVSDQLFDSYAYNQVQ